MITLQLNGKPLNIASSWNDVTYTHYCDILRSQELSLIDRIINYTGLPVEVLNRMTLGTLKALTDIVSFMDMPEVVHEFATPYKSDIKIAEKEYWKMEKAKQVIAAKGNMMFAGAEIVKLYTGDDITDKPILSVISQLTFFLHSSQHSAKGSNV